MMTEGRRRKNSSREDWCVFFYNLRLLLTWKGLKVRTSHSTMAARQKKRNDNIAMRNERKNDKKGSFKKARPGFETRVYSRVKRNRTIRASRSLVYRRFVSAPLWL